MTMIKITIDPAARHLVAERTIAGLTGFIGWDRLEAHLRRSGELKMGERITALEVSEQGLLYCVEARR